MIPLAKHVRLNPQIISHFFPITYLHDPTRTKGHWKTLPGGIDGVGLSDMMVAVMIDSSTSTRNATLAIISDLNNDLSYLANYGYRLDLCVTDRGHCACPNTYRLLSLSFHCSRLQLLHQLGHGDQ